MKVYFVRHGQSIYNADAFRNKTHQSLTTPLGDAGILQAEKVSERFRSIPIDIMYSSSATRALQTAETINKVIQKEIIVSDLLVERKNPTFFHGKERDDPELLKIKKMIHEHMDDLDWHYADEENFHDFSKRAGEFLELLEAETHKNILVVSHGYVMTLMMLKMVLKERLTSDIFTAFIGFNNTTNTGISMFEFNGDTWRLLTWNDYAHLG